MGRAIREDANTLDVQSAHRSLRAFDDHLQHLLGLVFRPCVSISAHARIRRAVPADLQGISTASKGGELHYRSDHGTFTAAHVRRGIKRAPLTVVAPLIEGRRLNLTSRGLLQTSPKA